MTPIEQTRPSSRLLLCVGLLALTSFAAELGMLLFASAGNAPAWQPRLWDGGLLAALALLALASFDWMQIRHLPTVQIRRSLPRSLSLHDWATVEIEVIIDGAIESENEISALPTTRRARSLPSPLEIQIFDHHPESLQAAGLPLRVTARPAATTRCSYKVRPRKRGDAHFGQPRLLASSPLGLWWFRFEAGAEADVRVYPNFAAVSRFGHLALDRHSRDVGVRKTQRRGEGLEFHQLRDYRLGDPVQRIDWKASSRKQQLISREYQDERDQRVIFLLDCSRRMRSKDGDLSHFDHALNAMILLSHVALKGGDAVGISSFGASSRWLPPQKGAASVNRILNTIYDLEASTQGSDFSSAAEALCRREPRRSLVVLITNLRSEDVDDLISGIRLLRRRHLVLIANLREQHLDRVAEQSPSDFRAALRAFGAIRHQRERAETAKRLSQERALALDVRPSQLSTELINRYYAVKRSGRL